MDDEPYTGNKRPRETQDGLPTPAATTTPVSRTASDSNPTPQCWGPPTSYATKSDKIVCVMVGLPARMLTDVELTSLPLSFKPQCVDDHIHFLDTGGKSYISRRLSRFISFFYGAPTRIFNVGDYRRKQANSAYQSADFFDPKNEVAMAQRQQAFEAALDDLKQWMSHTVTKRLDRDDLFVSGDFGAVAIFDATNTTRERREHIVNAVRPIGAKVIFIESICTDEEKVLENIMVKGPSAIGRRPFAFDPHVSAYSNTCMGSEWLCLTPTPTLPFPCLRWPR